MTSDQTTNTEQRLILVQRDAAKLATYPADAARALSTILRAMGAAARQSDEQTSLALREAAQEVRTLAARIGIQNEHMAILYDLATSAVEQRNDAHIAITKLQTAIQRRDINHPVIREFWSAMFEDVQEEYNATFWSSLPYDLANMLNWNHMQAQSLYDAITFDDREEVPEEYGWTDEMLAEFRANMLGLVENLRKGEQNDG